MHPVLFHIYKIAISPYGVLLALGLLLGVTLSLWRARRAGVEGDVILDVTFYGVLAGFVGGRAAYILTHLEDFFANPIGLTLDRAGFQFLGGLICAIPAGFWVIRRHRERVFQIADVMIPAVALGHFLGRLGCFFAGCCYGAVCPPGYEKFGVSFPRFTDASGALTGSPAYLDQLEAHPPLIPSTAAVSLPVWPTQLYEAAGNLVIFLFLMGLWRRRRYEGHIFVAYVAAYSCLRFGVEFFRGDVDRGILLRLSTSQWLSVAGVILAFVLWRRLRNNPPLVTPLAESALDAASAIEDSPTPAAPIKPRRRRSRVAPQPKV